MSVGRKNGSADPEILRALLRSAAGDVAPRGAKRRLLSRLEEDANANGRWLAPRGIAGPAALLLLALALGSARGGSALPVAFVAPTSGQLRSEAPRFAATPAAAATCNDQVEGPARPCGGGEGVGGGGGQGQGGGSSGGGVAGYSGSSSG